MNIQFDGQVFSFQEYGGISRYYCELIKQFSAMEGIEPSLVMKYSNNHYLPELDIIRVKHFFPAHRFKGRNEMIKFLNRNYARSRFHALHQPQVFHPTYYDPYFLELLGDMPYVLTIYDMSHELYPRFFSRLDFTATHKKQVATKANRIIAISEHTKKDVINLLNIPESKIDVIPLATTLSPPKTNTPAIPLPDKYFLYVGKRNTYKNFTFLLDAMKALSQIPKHSFLICAGGGKFTSQERKDISKLQLSDKIIQMDADDTLLAYLYTKAQALVFPSLYEGFGIPVLEAFACGCPALLSNRSSLPEVGGDAARYFDPESVSNLVERLVELEENRALADEMKTQGYKRLQLFSWENTARKTLETYKKVAS